MIPSDIRLEFKALSDFYDTHGITVSFLPTQIAEQFMKYPNNSLRVLCMGGDKLKTIVETNYSLKNYYGPAENTVVATCFTIDKMVDNIPIGTPIANAQVYILDQYLKPLPIGVAGELCISGESLAKGYLNNPEETAAKFIDNPFVPHTKMYRSGDLAKWNSTGQIEFLGRIDHQVKIRGNRVELGEVEQKILTYSGVNNAVVTALENQTGERILSAYLVADTPLNIDEIKLFLGKELPDYMVPPFMQQIETIPLTANGKVNKKALPDPKYSIVDSEMIKPTTPLEHNLAKIWGEILAIDEVGMTDHFFERGGNSLSAATFLGQIHKTLGYNIKLRNFFQTPTLKGVVKAIEQSETSQFVSINPIDEQERYAVFGCTTKDVFII